MKNFFDKTKILNMNMKNRFFRSAVWENLADDKGHLTEKLKLVYENLSKGGVGTIITGYAFVRENEQPNPGMMGIYDDSFIEEYKELTDIVHTNKSNIIMQIVYGGFMTSFNVEKRTIWGPSTMKCETTGAMAKEMSKEEIKNLIIDFANAALRAKKAGFDGVQIHAAHGYLLSQFLSPYYNKREDEYGGDIENRGRIIFEIYEVIRELVGKDFPIFIKLNSEDGIKEGGLTREDSIYVAKKLADLGIDAIEVSGGNGAIKEVRENGLGSGRNNIAKSKQNESYFKEYATQLAKQINIPVILVGGNRHLDIMHDLLNNTDIQYFSLARPLICEPDLINKWILGDIKSPKCVSCGKCYKSSKESCILNDR
ncbi:NADH:flavin oxidoreductase [Romboutsia sedimentorum]|uniref:NADH:flavin oxidoreductase n=1 Tax=Romboutsia sedimentorum TaxID=1368474 RepID=UPI0024DE6325|nr:NADH:flavin oxidoreductase [Romboutsia sedimentorum]MDK2586138.1 NADH:flavin oxidoreductase [Romboutsia sedimentorum]